MKANAIKGKHKGKKLATEKFFSNMMARVARWLVFKPKIPIWVNFGRPRNGKCWYI
jgi:hypothetical protein